MSSPPTFPLSTLHVRAWPDAVIDEVGHDPRSPYVEAFWLGILGPTATWLLRRLVAGLEEAPSGFDLDLARTATELGLGHRSGPHAPFLRSISRCCRFGATELGEAATLRVRRKLPPLTRAQIDRLPPHLQESHARWWTLHPADTSGAVEHLRRRARHLALSLLELGEDASATERQLHAWQVHPAMAHEATGWAVARYAAQQERTSPDAA